MTSMRKHDKYDDGIVRNVRKKNNRIMDYKEEDMEDMSNDYKGKCCCDKCKEYYGMRYGYKEMEDKKDNKKHDKKGYADNAAARLIDFEFFTKTPRNVQEPNDILLPVGMQTPVASVTLDEVEQGNVVWLNGVFGLDNDDPNDVATIIMRIFRGPIIPGQEIYRAVIEIDDEGNDDQVVEPLAHVDVITQDNNNVTYTVTLETDEDPVFLNGPVTFTAALIDKNNWNKKKKKG